MMVWLVIILLIASLLIVLYWYIHRGKFHKQRYAFFTVSMLFTFATVTIVPILAGDSIFYSINELVREYFKFAPPTPSTIYDKILSVLLFIVLLWFCHSIYMNWDGPVSEITEQNNYKGIKESLLADARHELQALISKSSIPIAEGKDSRFSTKNEINLETENSIEKYADLLVAFSPQYIIDLNENSFPDLMGFLCRYGTQETNTFVFCPDAIMAKEKIVNILHQVANLGVKRENCVAIIGDQVTNLKFLNIIKSLFPQVHLEHKLLDKIADFSTYKNYLSKMIKQQNIGFSQEYSLENTFTDLSAIANSSDKVDSVSDYIKNWVNEKSKRHLAMLGEYGQGKSTLALKITHDQLVYGDDDGRIPIIIELRGRTPRNEDIHQILYPWARKFGISTDALICLHRAGRLLIIFDAFDEMDFVGDAEIRYAHFRSLWNFAKYENAKIIITGRPNFFFDTSEMSRALLIRNQFETRPYCTTVRLSSMKLNQVVNALRNFPIDTKNEIITLIDSDTSTTPISELLRRPSTLIWAATIWTDLRKNIIGKNILSSNVVGQIVSQSLTRQSVKALSTPIIAAERELFIMAIALHIHNHNPGTNQISNEEIKTVVQMLVQHVPDKLCEFQELEANIELPLITRFQEQKRLIETLLTEIRTSSLLVEDIGKSGSFKFAHKSFYEFYIAKFYATHNITHEQSNSHCSIFIKLRLSNSPRFSIKVRNLSFVFRFLSAITPVSQRLFFEEIEYNNDFKVTELYYNAIKKTTLSLPQLPILASENEIAQFHGELILDFLRQNIVPHYIKEEMNLTETDYRLDLVNLLQLIFNGQPYSQLLTFSVKYNTPSKSLLHIPWRLIEIYTRPFLKFKRHDIKAYYFGLLSLGYIPKKEDLPNINQRYKNLLSGQREPSRERDEYWKTRF